MQLPPETKIAGDKKVSDWNNIKKSLSNFNNANAWESAYKDFFLKRLVDRYLDPIDLINRYGRKKGEGFSVMAILCSLVEFLETTYQGKNYRPKEKRESKAGEFDYDDGKSKEIFISFLTKRTPFKSEFYMESAKDFFEKVRCGLLHEARTQGKWIIKTTNTVTRIFDTKQQMMVIYRNNFYNGVMTYLEAYRVDLLSSNERKEAFIRKFDNICEE